MEAEIEKGDTRSEEQKVGSQDALALEGELSGLDALEGLEEMDVGEVVEDAIEEAENAEEEEGASEETGGEGGPRADGGASFGASFVPPISLVAALTCSITTAAATSEFVRKEVMQAASEPSVSGPPPIGTLPALQVRPKEQVQTADAERRKRERSTGRREAEERLRAACAPLPMDVDIEELTAASACAAIESTWHLSWFCPIFTTWPLMPHLCRPPLQSTGQWMQKWQRL